MSKKHSTIPLSRVAGLRVGQGGHTVVEIEAACLSHAVAESRRVDWPEGLISDTGKDGNRRAAGWLGAQRIIELPQPVADEDVVSHTVIFEIGTDRFAMTWSAEIERLPPVGL